jgi:peroxiredoxin
VEDRNQLERSVLNGLIFVAIIAVLWRAAAAYNLESVSGLSEDRAPLARGMSLDLSEVDWSVTKRSAVLFLSPSCPACNASTRFYSELSANVSSTDNVRLVVIGYEDVDDLERWLSRNSIHASQVIQVRDPGSLGLTVTPTLFIVDLSGRVTDLMVAGLSATEESLVYARLRPDADAPPLDNTTVFREIDDVEMHQAIEVVGTQVLFPVERADAAEIMRARSSGSASFINIPEDEISTRARIETRRRGRRGRRCAAHHRP